jgi:hypothetical protein
MDTDTYQIIFVIFWIGSRIKSDILLSVCNPSEVCAVFLYIIIIIIILLIIIMIKINFEIYE